MAGLSFWTPLLPLFLSFAYCALTAHNLDKYPPSFVFEEEMKAHLGESVSWHGRGGENLGIDCRR
jgi:hypothetical protein